MVCATGHEERDGLLLELADARNDGDDGLELGDAALLDVDGLAHACLLVIEVQAPLVDSLTFAGEGGNSRGDGRGQESEVVAQLGELGRVRGAGAENGEGREGL